MAFSLQRELSHQRLTFNKRHIPTMTKGLTSRLLPLRIPATNLSEDELQMTLCVQQRKSIVKFARDFL